MGTSDQPEQVWKLSNMGDATEEDLDRFQVMVELENPDSWQFCLGRKIGSGFPDIRVELLDKSDPEDMPWSDSCVYLASDRLRAFLKEILPGQQQFLPTKLVRKGKTVTDFRYWAVNWLRMVDCFDRERSEYQVVPVPGHPNETRHSFDRLVINKAAVPEDAAVFRVQHYETVVIARDWVRKRLEYAGMTGCQFYDVLQVER